MSTKESSAPAATSRSAQPRQPSQARSRIRYDALLEATAKLLEDRDFTEIGLYDIAEHAGVPPASAYHFFPTKEAAFVALAERHLEDLAVQLNQPVDLTGIGGWQDLLAVRLRRAVGYYHENPSFARIALSGSVIAEIRRVDTEFLSNREHTPLGFLSHYLMMPYIPDADLRFTCLIGIYDGIWTLSYARHGCISEEYEREALRAGLAYCRSFLPEVIPFRDPAEFKRPSSPVRQLKSKG